MSRRHPSAVRRLWPAWLRITCGVAIGYLSIGLIGMSLAVPPSNATLIFPAAGLAVAAALRFGLPAIWGIGLGPASPSSPPGWEPSRA